MTRTNAHTVLCVLIRAFAAYGVVTVGLAVIEQLYSPPSDWEAWHRAAFYALAMAPLVVMWIFPDWLAKLALVRKTGEVFESDVESRQLLGMALAAAGAIIVVDHLITAARYLFLYMYYARRDPEEIHSTFAEDHAVGVATTIVAIVLGSALFAGSRALAAAAYRFRYGDIERPRSDIAVTKSDEP